MLQTIYFWKDLFEIYPKIYRLLTVFEINETETILLKWGRRRNRFSPLQIQPSQIFFCSIGISNFVSYALAYIYCAYIRKTKQRILDYYPWGKTAQTLGFLSTDS